jgi:predicted enzyme related to lactoylglutathione lyase
MLKSASLVGFVATAHPEDAKRFYEHVLGLALAEDGPYAMVFKAGGNTVRVQKVQQVQPAPYTVLGWSVADIRASVEAMATRGLVFERYAGLLQDEHAIWRTPDGSSVAWFRDPDGNILSLTEYAK